MTVPTLTWNQVNAWRLAQHGLAPRWPCSDFLTAASRICGLHAQVMSAAELALAGRLHGATNSPAARDLLLDLVGALLAQQGEQVTDHDAGLRLRAVTGPNTVVSSPDGTTTFVRLSLTVSAAEGVDKNWLEPAWGVAQ